MYDIVFPRGNEEELVLTAARLGYSGLCLVYDSSHELAKSREKLKQDKIKLFFGVRKRDRESAGAVVFSKASGKSRSTIERKEADVVYDFENNLRGDYLHHRASGLNQVLCKLAEKNGIAIGFSLSSIICSGKKSVLLGRIRQNIRLCRKYEVKMVIGSFCSNAYGMRAVHDVASLFCLLG